MIQVDILDREVFAGIDPQNVEKYLRANQWIEQQRLHNDIGIWYKQDSVGKIYRIWLPLNYKLADFSIAMKRSVETIAQAEHCSQLQVFEDFNTVAIGDIIRLNTYDELSRHASTLPLDVGLTLIEQGRGITASAAMSEMKPREVHPSRRAAVVTKYLNELRLGQTEYGSYTIKLISPIGEVQEDPYPTLPEMPVRVPFERRAVMKLVQSLSALRDVSEDLHKRGSFNIQPFIEMVPQGISANLCEAVAYAQDKEYHPIEVSVTWSYILDNSQTERTNAIVFPVGYMRYIAEAAERFRARNPESRSIQGYVKVLSREKGESYGTISLISNIDNRQCSVRMELKGESYQTAIRAHQEEIFASVSGRLVKKGHIFWLENPKDFYLIENESLPM